MRRTKFYNLLEFYANISDDAVFDSKGNPVIPGGRIVTESLAAALHQRGIRVSEVKQWEDYGWYFYAFQWPCRIWFLLQLGEPWILLSEAQTPLIVRLRFKSCNATYLAMLKNVHECLARDNRFSRMRWYVRSEHDAGRQGPGAPEPGYD
jgi:hypothetical protein